MSIAGQRLNADRYALIPRTLAFLYHDDHLLLQRVAPSKGKWAGKYNGVGGHVERGEDPLSAARREIHEETGLRPNSLILCGVIAIDMRADLGIGLYVFAGRVADRRLSQSEEGSCQWFRRSAVTKLPLVEDLRILIPAVEAALENQRAFSAVYHYGPDGALDIDIEDGTP